MIDNVIIEHDRVAIKFKNGEVLYLTLATAKDLLDNLKEVL